MRDVVRGSGVLLGRGRRGAGTRHREPVGPVDAPAGGGRGTAPDRCLQRAGAVPSVREGGLEPPRPFGHWHLKPARLPFRHSRAPEHISTVRTASPHRLRAPRPGSPPSPSTRDSRGASPRPGAPPAPEDRYHRGGREPAVRCPPAQVRHRPGPAPTERERRGASGRAWRRAGMDGHGWARTGTDRWTTAQGGDRGHPRQVRAGRGTRGQHGVREGVPQRGQARRARQRAAPGGRRPRRRRRPRAHGRPQRLHDRALPDRLRAGRRLGCRGARRRARGERHGARVDPAVRVRRTGDRDVRRARRPRDRPVPRPQRDRARRRRTGDDRARRAPGTRSSTSTASATC